MKRSETESEESNRTADIIRREEKAKEGQSGRDGVFKVDCIYCLLVVLAKDSNMWQPYDSRESGGT